MAKSPAPEAAPGLVRVYPSPDLPSLSYVPGVGAAGSDVPREQADRLLAAGLVTTTPPVAAPDEE